MEYNAGTHNACRIINLMFKSLSKLLKGMKKVIKHCYHEKNIYSLRS